MANFKTQTAAASRSPFSSGYSLACFYRLFSNSKLGGRPAGREMKAGRFILSVYIQYVPSFTPLLARFPPHCFIYETGRETGGRMVAVVVVGGLKWVRIPGELAPALMDACQALC